MAVLSFNGFPPGSGFHPTDKQIIDYYLRSKINGNEDAVEHIPEVELCRHEPWDLPAKSLIEPNNGEFFFFCPKDCKYKNGNRWNRMTREGFWKPTGNDRSIKSGQGGTEIGKKKTLVFYIGRAGQAEEKTTWVIHEYYATSEELDGTKPGQKGSFVLLKLKKQQLDNEIAEGSNGTTIHTPLPIENNVANNNARDKSIVQPDTDLPDTDPELWRHLADIIPEPLDVLDKIPSPLHSQMQPDLESSQNLHFLISNDGGPDPNGVEIPCGPDDQAIIDYLNSVLVEDYESNKNLAVECEVDAEAPQAQFDHEGSSSNSNVVSNDDAFGTGIKLRTRQPHDQPSSKNFEAQGNAARRIRLQRKLNVHLSYNNNFTDLSYKEENHEAELAVPKAEEAEEKHSATAESAAITDETQDIFSKFKEEHLSSPEGSRNDVSIANTFGDLSYKEENHEAKLVLAKAEESEEKHSISADPAAVIDETQDTSLSVFSSIDFPRVTDKDVPSTSLRAPTLLSAFSSMLMVGVLLSVLSVAFVGFWRSLEF